MIDDGETRSPQSKGARTPLSRLAAQQIVRKIENGDFAVGSRLPAQRNLAASMGISRTVLREAISVLEASDYVRTAAGSGTYVNASTGEAERLVGVDAIGLPGSYAKLDICRFRHVFEGACARLAAMRVTDSDIDRLGTNLQSFKEQIRTGNFDQSAETDEAFHHMIVEIADVPLFTDVHRAFRKVLLETLRMPVKMRSRGWEPVVEHERIYEALKRRDPDEAMYYTRSHIARSSERLGYIMADELL